MNSFNNIKRLKYQENQQSVVSLDEYAIFTDDRKKEKYIVFKFSNNLNQMLYGIRFEVTQYNEAGNIIEKNFLKYNQISIGKNQTFIPEAKLLVKFACEKVSVKLLYAHFTTTIWENGVFTPVKMSFDDYKKDIPLNKTKKELKEELKKAKKNRKTAEIQYNTTKKIQKRMMRDIYCIEDGHSTEIDKRNRFKIAEVSKRNKVVIPKIISFVLCLAVVVLSVVLSFSYSTQNFDKVSVDEFDYKVNGEIAGYYGDDSVVEVEGRVTYTINRNLSTYFNYGVSYLTYIVKLNEKPILDDKLEDSIVVKAIGDRAFAGKNLEKIILPSSVKVLGSESFMNCVNFNSIDFNGYGLILKTGCLQNTGFNEFSYEFVENVEALALSDCDELETVKIPNATVYKDAFVGSENISYLEIGNTNVEKFIDLFGGSIPNSLTKVGIHMRERDLPEGFFEGVNLNVVNVYYL